MMRPVPSRDDVAADMIVRACGYDHDFPDDVLKPTETEIDSAGRTINVNRVPCRACGTIMVSRWQESSGPYLAVTRMHEPPEPGDIPGIAERTEQVTDAEFAEFLATQGFPEGVPTDFAPDRRTTATTERLDFVLRIKAGQFFLLDRNGPLNAILPVPPHAESAELIEAVAGAAVFWTAEGELPLTVIISPADPRPDRSYDRIAEVSCHFHTGHVELREVAGRKLPLPPLPAGHGDYRLRLHTNDSGCLLHIFNQPRSKPLVH
ncbi:hypothetical protein [Kibdelosporangium aridum]|uniref:Uncharacterized protein n=1 Tax=Kibdelosporangium aridum TaxID=2030 RepID=A0A1Y5Y818_KIBAR|nr:hypothetical protein [Kibdelosporangium aridum]SMD25829.1 hypothetical protein SAMN05661093_09407 [Kibdelosporangium aridum]